MYYLSSFLSSSLLSFIVVFTVVIFSILVYRLHQCNNASIITHYSFLPCIKRNHKISSLLLSHFSFSPIVSVIASFRISSRPFLSYQTSKTGSKCLRDMIRRFDSVVCVSKSILRTTYFMSVPLQKRHTTPSTEYT